MSATVIVLPAAWSPEVAAARLSAIHDTAFRPVMDCPGHGPMPHQWVGPINGFECSACLLATAHEVEEAVHRDALIPGDEYGFIPTVRASEVPL